MNINYTDMKSLIAYTQSVDCIELPDDATTRWFRELIDVIAHDLKNRINSLTLHLYLLKKTAHGVDVELNSKIDLMHEEIDTIKALIDAMQAGATPCHNAQTD